MLKGAITVGDRFMWERDKPHAREVIEVVEVKPPNEDGEVWIGSKHVRYVRPGEHMLYMTGRADEVHWNDEDRFREACSRLKRGEDA